MNELLSSAKLVTLDETLKLFITRAGFNGHGNFAILTNRFDHSKMIQRECSRLIDEIPGWLFPKIVRMMTNQIELSNGSRLFFMNSCLQCKGITLNAIALANHVEWSREDLECIIPCLYMHYWDVEPNILRFTE